MRLFPQAIALAILTAGAAGCGSRQTEPFDSPRRSEAKDHGHLNHALPRLSTIKLWVSSRELVAEVARRAAEVQTGMMFRTNMADNEGMLFVFARPLRASFYMRNTTVPLSCAYLDPDGVILEVHDLKPLDETPVEAGSDNVQFVLETAQGWFARNQVHPGMVVRSQYGALRDLDWLTLRPAKRR